MIVTCVAFQTSLLNHVYLTLLIPWPGLELAFQPVSSAVKSHVPLEPWFMNPSTRFWIQKYAPHRKRA